VLVPPMSPARIMNWVIGWLGSRAIGLPNYQITQLPN
jgi:hypothetical protein